MLLKLCQQIWLCLSNRLFQWSLTHYKLSKGKAQCFLFILYPLLITADGDCSHEVKRCLLLGRKVMTNLDSILKSREITLPTKVPLVKAVVFPIGHVWISNPHVWMCELDYKETWAPKNWCFWTVVLEKTLESPLDCKEIQPVHPKGDQSRVFIGRTDVEAETPMLWPPDAESWLICKDPDAGKDWGQEEKGTTENEIVGWHHRLDGHGFGWTPGVGDGQGGLACCGSWGRRGGHDWTELNPLLLGFKHWWMGEERCHEFQRSSSRQSRDV